CPYRDRLARKRLWWIPDRCRPHGTGRLRGLALGRRRRAQAVGKCRQASDVSRLKGAARYEIAQRIRRHDDNPASLQLEPLPALPGLKLLVRAFTRYPDHLTDLTLGHLNFGLWRRVRRWPIEMQQHLGEAVRQA